MIKGTAQLSVDNALDGLGLVQAIISLGKNPKGIEDMRSSLIEANTIADDRKKEADEALKAIAQADIATKKLEQDKIDFEQAQREVSQQLLVKKTALETAATELAKQKDEFAVTSSAQIEEIAHMAAEATEKHKSADERQKAMNKMQADLESGKAALKQGEVDLEKKRMAHTTEVAKFATRQKALADAARNAVEGN